MGELLLRIGIPVKRTVLMGMNLTKKTRAPKALEEIVGSVSALGNDYSSRVEVQNDARRYSLDFYRRDIYGSCWLHNLDHQRRKKEMRAYAELIKKWLDDETLELEYLSDRDKWEPAPNPFSDLTALYRERLKAKKLVSKWLWAIQIGEETLQSVYFCANKEEVFKRYNNDVVILCRIEASKIEVEE